MESILHVLIYVAVRFLPHNADDAAVLRLLYNYFDDYSDTASGFKCGPAKYHAMKTGEIDITLDLADMDGRQATLGEARPGKILEFYDVKENGVPNASPELHPINDVIKKLLTWFEDFYSLSLISTNKVRRATAGTSRAEAPASKMSARLAQFSSLKSSSSHSSTPRRPPPSPEEIKAIKEKVEGHSHMAALLARALADSSKWSKTDKGPDKRSRKGYVRAREDTFLATRSLLSVKRTLPEHPDE